MNEVTQRQKENGSQENGIAIGRSAEEIIITDLETPHHPLTFDCCIYKIPNNIRNQNEAAYSPRVVSIGPFHHGDGRLKSMENLKLTYLKSFLARVGHGLLKDYVETLKDLEDKIRRCYAEEVEPSKDKFVWMILIDSCFIFEHFLRELSNEDHVLLQQSCTWFSTAIVADLILLENQIPFFVLNTLYNKAIPRLIIPAPISGIPFPGITIKFFYAWNLPCNVAMIEQVKHFTDLVRMLYSPPVNEEPRTSRLLVEHLPTASQLHEAGLKFRVISGEGHLHFENGGLEMAPFEADDDNETLIRNAVAFEQCHHDSNYCVSQYVFLLDFLINTDKDVEVLVEQGIITNGLGDYNAVATMVNNLSRNLAIPGLDSHYKKVCDDLNKFYKDPCHKWKAILGREYCSTPWKIAGSVAAVLIIFFTFVQTICSVISVT